MADAARKNYKTALKELFLDKLEDIYLGEKQVTKALTKMSKNRYIAESEQCFGRLGQVFEILNTLAYAKR